MAEGKQKGKKKVFCDNCGRSIYIEITGTGEPVHEGKNFCDDCLIRLDETP